MLLTKLKTPLVLIIAIALAGAGIWNLSYRAAAKEQTTVRSDQPQGDVKQHDNPVPGNLILSSDGFLGKWTGEKDGIKVELTFNGEKARWQAHWQVGFRKSRKPENPQQSPTVGINIGADLKCVADVKAGRLNLYLTAYKGDKKELKQSSFNSLRPVGHIKKGADGTLQLRIIPTGHENLADHSYDYPAVESLILHRVAEPTKEGKKTPDEKKLPNQDQAKQALDMVLKGFQAYQASKDDRKPLLQVPLPDRTMMTVRLSANGRLLAVAPHDKTTVELWDVATGKSQTLKGHAFSVTAVAFSPDGKTLATGTGSWLPDGAPGEIRLWDVASGKELASLGRYPEMIVALAFSPDGKTLASVSKTVKLWDVSSGKERSELNPNDEVWLSFANGNVVHRVPRACWSVALSPDGKTLAVGVGVLEDNTPGAALLYDVSTGKLRATLPGHKGAVACLAFTPDGKTLASADSRGNLKLWDVATAKERASIRTPDGTFGSFFLQSLAFATDGKTVVSTMLLGPPQPGCVLKEWDVADGKERTIHQGTPKGFPMVLSEDGTIVGLAGPALGLGEALVGPSGKMELWELRSLRAVRTPKNAANDESSMRNPAPTISGSFE